jgi:hypothetical protein
MYNKMYFRILLSFLNNIINNTFNKKQIKNKKKIIKFIMGEQTRKLFAVVAVFVLYFV